MTFSLLCGRCVCNPAFADRSGMAASRFLAAAAACVIVLSLQLGVLNRIVVGLHEGCEWCFGSRFFYILALMIFL